MLQDTTTYYYTCNTLQHTATHCNTLQHSATFCNTLQHTATHCNTLQHSATHCNTWQHCVCRHYCVFSDMQVANPKGSQHKTKTHHIVTQPAKPPPAAAMVDLLDLSPAPIPAATVSCPPPTNTHNLSTPRLHISHPTSLHPTP